MSRPRFTLQDYLETWPYGSILRELSTRHLTSRDLSYLVLGRLPPRGRGKLTIDPQREASGEIPGHRQAPSAQAFNNYLQRLRRRGYIRRRRDGCWELPVARLPYLLSREAHLGFMVKVQASEVWGSADGDIVVHGAKLDELLGSPPFALGDPGVQHSLRVLAAVDDLRQGAGRLWSLLWSLDPALGEALRRQREVSEAFRSQVEGRGMTENPDWFRDYEARRRLIASDPKLQDAQRQLEALHLVLRTRAMAISILAPDVLWPLGPRAPGGPGPLRRA